MRNTSIAMVLMVASTMVGLGCIRPAFAQDAQPPVAAPAPAAPPVATPAPAAPPTAPAAPPATTPPASSQTPFGASTSSPPAPPTAPIAQADASQTIAQFNSQVSLDLLNRGIGGFNTPDVTNPATAEKPLYEPVRVQVGGPFGSFYGTAQIFAGLSTYRRPDASIAGANSDVPDYPNLETLITLNYLDHVRGHIEANLLRLPFNTAGKRLVGLPEAYAEFYTDGRIPSTNSALAGSIYHVSARFGKQGQLQFPYINPLELFNRISAGYFSYQGAMLLGSIDRPDGTLVHASLYRRIGSSGIGPPGFLRDAYLGYQHYEPVQKIFYEARGGWMSRNQDDIPSNGGLGIQGYGGYQSSSFGAGVFLGDIFKQGPTFGVGITLGRSVGSELGGLAPTHILQQPPAVGGDVPDSTRNSFGFALEAPVADFYLLAASHPTAGEALVGQKNFISTWNTGNEVGVGTTDTLASGQWGQQFGKDVRRVLALTPWWLYHAEGLFPSKKSGGNTGGEHFVNYRQDSEFTYYRVLPYNNFPIDLTAVDADTQKPVARAAITITGPNGTNVSVTTSNKGAAHTRLRLQPTETPNVHIAGTAAGYDPLAQDVTLTPNTANRITLQFKPLTGTINGTVTDAALNTGVPDVEVILTPPSIGGAPPVTPTVHTTGPDGTYQFTDVHPGSYLMRVHKPGYNDVQGPVNVIGGQSLDASFKVVAQQGGIAGHVVDANGAAVPGATATIVNAAGTTVATLTAGADGNFAQRLDPATYTVNVTAAGYTPTPVTVTVPPGELQNVTITLQKQP